MQIKFNDTDSVEIALKSRGSADYIYDCNLLVSLKTASSSFSQEVWVDGYEFKTFLNGIELLRSSLSGSVSISSESPGELFIAVKAVDSLGHFVFQIELGRQTFIGPEPFWSKVQEAFPLESASLDSVCKKLKDSFGEVINA